MNAATTNQFVVTSFDHNLMRSITVAGPFTDMGAAVAEAGRMNAFDKYRHQFLMVDLAAFVSAGRKARSHHPDGSARGR
jgi:hypothetical protein